MAELPIRLVLLAGLGLLCLGGAVALLVYLLTRRPGDGEE